MLLVYSEIEGLRSLVRGKFAESSRKFINNRCAVEIEFRQICAYNIQSSVCDADNKMTAFHIGYA